jgi:hypothetical protein
MAYVGMALVVFWVLVAARLWRGRKSPRQGDPFGVLNQWYRGWRPPDQIAPPPAEQEQMPTQVKRPHRSTGNQSS